MCSTIGTGAEWAIKRGYIFMLQMFMTHNLPNTGDLFGAWDINTVLCGRNQYSRVLNIA